MPDAPDPFGRRALFWAPGERDTTERRPDEEDPSQSLGKRALFSHASPPRRPTARRRGERRTDATATPTQNARNGAHPAGRRESVDRTAAGSPILRALGDDEQVPTKAGRTGRSDRNGRGGGNGRGDQRGVTATVTATVISRIPGATKAIEAAGPVHLACVSCGAVTEVDMVEFVRLHVPFWLWRPGRGYARFMTCPACKRRTWISASWRPPMAAAIRRGGR